MNEKSRERTDKGGSSTESFDLRGRVSPFFVFFSLSSCYCISSLFFIEEEVNDDTWRKEHFLGKNSSLSFFSKVLSFFFGLQKTGDNVSRASICDAQPIITLGSHEIDRRNFDR